LHWSPLHCQFMEIKYRQKQVVKSKSHESNPDYEIVLSWSCFWMFAVGIS
jgi:hypothetical protein